MDENAQLLTLDLLLALVPLTIALAMSANVISGLTFQIQDYIYGYSMQRIATDSTDVLIKTAGDPPGWSSANTVDRLGLAYFHGVSGRSCAGPGANLTMNNVLDSSKLSELTNNYNSTALKSALQNLVGGNNIRIQVTNSTSTVLDVAGGDFGGGWSITISQTTINNSISAAPNVYASERAIGILQTTAPNGSFNQLWNYDPGVSSTIQSAPAVGDLDGDGLNEIVFGSNDDKIYALFKNGSLFWSYDTGNDTLQSSPNLADIDGDGKLEVVIGNKGNKLIALNYDGSLRWNVTLSDQIQASPAIANLDDDSALEIAITVAGTGNSVYVLDTDGSELWPPISVGCRFRSSPAIADVDNVGGLDVVVTSDPEPSGCGNSSFYAYKGSDGTQIGVYALPSATDPHLHASPAVADLDGDGIKEIVNQDTNGTLWIVYGNNVTLKQSVSGVGGESSPALSDLNSDGKIEIVVASKKENAVKAFYHNGSLLWSYSTGSIGWGSPAVGDVDGDCKLEVVVGDADGDLYVINGEDGTLSQQFTVSGVSFEDASPIISDFDSDNSLEILIGGSNNRLYVFDTPGSNFEWPMFHQCSKRAGYYYDSDCGGSLGSAPTLETISTRITEGRIKVWVWR